MRQDELFFGPIQKFETIKAGDLVKFRKPVGNVIPFDYLRFEEVVGYVKNVENFDGTGMCSVFFGTEIIECAANTLTKERE